MGSAAITNHEWSSSGKSSTDFDVFLNFRGEDTRLDLIDILRHFMVQSGIRFFYDDGAMRIGDKIDEQLMRGIERSQIYVLILSKRYAESKWCLRELTYMVKCQEESRHGRKVILPVFYGVSVGDVKLTGSAYAADLEKLDVLPEERQNWQIALRKIAAIKGLHFGNRTGAAEFSQSIVREVQSRLKMGHLSYHLVGIDEEVREVEKKLDVESSIVRFLVIHGKGGTGKTTLARAVFQRLSGRFQGCSFITDISEMKRRYGFIYLEHILLRDICGDDGKQDYTKESFHNKKGVCSDDGKRDSAKESFHDKKVVCGDNCKLGDHMERSFRDKKVLIVLDGVDKWEQIENLVGTSTWFGPGSRIVITISEEELVSMQQDIDEGIWNSLGEVYSHEKKEMKLGPAIKLFSRYAFWRDSPLENFRDLTSMIVNYCQGLPLILEIVGSLLHRKRDQETWQKIVNILEQSQLIQKWLVNIYDILQDNEKKIFLDIACFFVHEEKTNPTYMWNTSTSEDDGLESLLMLSLVKIVDGNKLWMHDHVRNLGREIVRQNSLFRLERSRFWEHDDAFGALTCKEGKQIVEGICLYYYGKRRFSSTLTHEEFCGKRMLRFLRLYSVKFSGNFAHCFPKLRWLSWHGAPEEFEATNFASLTLVILDLARSRITANWDGWDQLKEENNLRVIDLTSCQNLTETPCFSQFTHLERLVLANCSQLKEIHPSIGELKLLRCLNIKGCDSLGRLPEEICSLKNLTEIVITKKFPGSFILPNGIGELELLTTLEIVHVNIAELPDSIGSLENLQHLSLSRCSGLYQLPESIGQLRSLVELDISESEIVRFPNSIGYLQALKVIKMEYSSVTELPRTIGMVQKLERMEAKYCTALQPEIPERIQDVLHLKVLDLSHTSVSRLPQRVRQLTNLQKLQLPSCCSISSWSELPKSLTHLSITFPALCPMHENPSRPEGFPKLEKLQVLELHIPNGTVYQMQIRDFAPRLKSLNLSFQDLQDLQCCSELPETLSKLILQKVKVDTASPHFDRLKELSSLELHNCQIFDKNNQRCCRTGERGIDIKAVLSFPLKKAISFFSVKDAILFDNKLDSLAHFSAFGCTFCIDKELHLPKRLRLLHMTECVFQSRVLHFSGLDCLNQLMISRCKGLARVEGLGELASLEELKIHGCIDLEKLGGDISKSNKLRVYIVADNDELRELVTPSKKLKHCVVIGRNLPSTSASSPRGRRSLYTPYLRFHLVLCALLFLSMLLSIMVQNIIKLQLKDECRR